MGEVIHEGRDHCGECHQLRVLLLLLQQLLVQLSGTQAQV